jgi:two-component system cell cycle sensor histidine kinase PleC
MMVFGLIVLVCNAACISGIGPHLPAFFGYCLGSTVPLAIALYRRGEPETHDLAFLIPLYIAVVGFNARDYNRQVLSAFRLRAENEELAENLARANVETADAKRSKWNTLAHLSHELRTPMNAIMGFSQMMRDEIFGKLIDRYRDYSGHIHDSGRHMLELVDTILDVSQAETGNLTIEDGEFVPADLVEECLQKVGYAAATKTLALERNFTPAPHLIADRTKLRQALLHLLNNAVAYTRDGGRVAVALSCDTEGLAIAITDTGVGIAPEDLERCQEPFVRVGNPLIAGAEGAGLGLPLARRVVEAHGGTLGLASEPGRGTTATIRLPVARCVWRGEERKRA